MGIDLPSVAQIPLWRKAIANLKHRKGSGHITVKKYLDSGGKVVFNVKVDRKNIEPTEQNGVDTAKAQELWDEYADKRTVWLMLSRFEELPQKC